MGRVSDVDAFMVVVPDGRETYFKYEVYPIKTLPLDIRGEYSSCLRDGGSSIFFKRLVPWPVFFGKEAENAKLTGRGFDFFTRVSDPGSSIFSVFLFDKSVFWFDKEDRSCFTLLSEAYVGNDHLRCMIF